MSAAGERANGPAEVAGSRLPGTAPLSIAAAAAIEDSKGAGAAVHPASLEAEPQQPQPPAEPQPPAAPVHR